jgi:hypothetical protein
LGHDRADSEQGRARQNGYKCWTSFHTILAVYGLAVLGFVMPHRIVTSVLIPTSTRCQ